MNRSTLILFFLLLALGAIAYFLIPSSQEREASDKSPQLDFSVDSASVVKIEFLRGAKSLTLENIGGKWMITSPGKYTADPSAVLAILQGLSKFKVGSLISSNPEKQRLFQVDTSGTQITATDRAGKTNAIVIGKMGPSFSEVYCRPPGSKFVYLGEGLDSWSVNKEMKDWRDKSIASIPSESVKSLIYALNNRQYEYVRDSTTWKLGASAIDGAVMNSPLTTLANLRAEDFVDTVMRFSSQPVGVSVKGTSNVSLQLYPSLPDSSKYFVQSSLTPQIYVISKYTAQQILKPVDHSKAAPRSPYARKEESAPPPQTKIAVKEEKPVTSAPVAGTKSSSAASTTTAPKTVPPPKETVSAPAEKHDNAVQNTGGAAMISEKPPPKPATLPDLSTGKKAPVKKASVPGSSETKSIPPVTGGETAVTGGAAATTGGGAAVTEKSGAASKPPPAQTPPAEKPKTSTSGSADDEGDLTVYTVKAGDTMPSIAKKNNCTVEQILKWNLLKSINVKPGQELYIYVKK